jgi:carboxypeptidase Taq
MSKDFDIEKSLESGTVRKIEDWNREHIHKYGSSKDPKDILKMATGEKFNSDYYINYLISKYSKIYNIK